LLSIRGRGNEAKRAMGSLKSVIGVVVTGGEGPTFKSAESGLVQ
jgi:hypothetical protein